MIGRPRKILGGNRTAFDKRRVGIVVRSIQHSHGPVVDVILVVIKAQNLELWMVALQRGP